MDACNKMTKEQALKEMELFKAVFDGGFNSSTVLFITVRI